ncbi:variant erythrocyte surface antigen-1 family protein [Babesia caballi]|uniref:Variant erythrocyte surface antigen-1 family protein n=1 Tax=Babesia caballi TaxID=5871 RepID=A0AAV4LYN6_BABCB|nr:variant erythrocyte surface antigen-1 family protein [Babesia caballi]
MVEQHTSLNYPPKSLKYGIDWVLCMSGNDGRDGGEGKKAIKKLAEKVMSLLMVQLDDNRGIGMVNGISAATLLAGDASSRGHKPIESLGNGLRMFVGYPNGIGKQNYEYSYRVEKQSDSIGDDAAKIFLGLTPLLFFGLGFLCWKCDNKWSKHNLSSSHLMNFLHNMGFSNQLNGGKTGFHIASNAFTLFTEFRGVAPMPSTYPFFLKEVGEKAFKGFKTDPNSYPLYTLYFFAYYYLKYLNPCNIADTVNGLPTTNDGIKETLQWLETAVKNLDLQEFEDLITAYSTLRTEITEAMDVESTSSDPSSHAAPVAGTLSTLGLGSGAAAAYMFNLGGAKTLVNGLLRIG